MSAEQLNQLWEIERKNQLNIAILQERMGTMCEQVKELEDSNKALKEIIDRALGAKTFAGIVGGIIGTLFTAAISVLIAYFGRN